MFHLFSPSFFLPLYFLFPFWQLDYILARTFHGIPQTSRSFCFLVFILPMFAMYTFLLISNSFVHCSVLFFNLTENSLLMIFYFNLIFPFILVFICFFVSDECPHILHCLQFSVCFF